MDIPHTTLRPETLRALLEEIATRDGTDYGEVETELDVRVARLTTGLQRGEMILQFDEATQTCSVVAARA